MTCFVGHFLSVSIYPLNPPAFASPVDPARSGSRRTLRFRISQFRLIHLRGRRALVQVWGRRRIGAQDHTLDHCLGLLTPKII